MLFNFNTAPLKIEMGKKNHLSTVEFKSFNSRTLTDRVIELSLPSMYIFFLRPGYNKIQIGGSFTTNI